MSKRPLEGSSARGPKRVCPSAHTLLAAWYEEVEQHWGVGDPGHLSQGVVYSKAIVSFFMCSPDDAEKKMNSLPLPAKFGFLQRIIDSGFTLNYVFFEPIIYNHVDILMQYQEIFMHYVRQLHPDNYHSICDSLGEAGLMGMKSLVESLRGP